MNGKEWGGGVDCGVGLLLGQKGDGRQGELLECLVDGEEDLGVGGDKETVLWGGEDIHLLCTRGGEEVGDVGTWGGEFGRTL